MNDIAIDTIMRFRNERLISPNEDMPRESYFKVSYSIWAVYELLERVMDHPLTSADDIINEFALKMECCRRNYAAICIAQKFERRKLMNKPDFVAIVKSVRTAMKRHSPEILTGIGIAGMITTTVMAVRATPKALILIDEREKAAEFDGSDEPLPNAERVKAAWRCYIPAAAVGCASVACLIGASSVNIRRNAALATAYTLSESALKEYQEKVVEAIGDKKERSIRDSVAKDRITNKPVENSEVVITDRGNTLCYDVLSGRYFKTDIDKIRKAANELNRQMRDEMYISLNEFYYAIGLDGIKVGEDLGWNIDTGYIELDFSSQLAKDDTPCLVIDYQVAPRYDFMK